jgi:hypothetical protein
LNSLISYGCEFNKNLLDYKQQVKKFLFYENAESSD